MIILCAEKTRVLENWKYFLSRVCHLHVKYISKMTTVCEK